MAKLKNSELILSEEPVDIEVIEEDEVITKTISKADQARIIRQVESEFDLAFSFNEAKRKQQLARLKLYNNQKRDDDAVGDPLLFTIFDTIMSALYEDRLMSVWEGRGGEGDEDVEDNLNALAEFDYDVMQKAESDYEWDWDAAFFGRSLLLMMDFEREKGIQAPIPEVIDPTTWIRDPRAKSVNGDMRGRGAMRFGGREIGLSYWEMKDNSDYFNIDLLKKTDDLKSLSKEAREARREAQNLENFSAKEEQLGAKDNYEYPLLEWFTHYKGEKCLVTLGNGRRTLVRYKKLKDKNKWPIIDRVLFPMAHDWDGVSVPDLVEDKQRARSIMINLGLKSAKADVIPVYLFDNTRIKNRNNLNFKINKFIPVDGRVDNAMMPVQKPSVHQHVDKILQILDVAAQKATATPELQQGMVSSGDRTLGELELVSNKVNARFSIRAKVFGWSERAFWRQWYQLYKQHFKEGIDEKIVRIQGATAPIWRPLTREQIIANVDPDVRVESRIMSEAKRFQDMQQFGGFAAFALQDPDTNRRYVLKHMAKLNGLRKEQIDIMFPKTIEEMHAEEENELLNEGKLPPIDIRDDHMLHMEIHSKALQNAESVAHLRMHKKLMLLRRNHPELFQPPQQPEFPTPGANGQPGKPGQATAPAEGMPANAQPQ